MKLSVVTTFSPKGYEVYGRKMVESFADFWPTNVPLYAYYEGEKPMDAHDRATWVSLDADTDRTAFLKKYQDKGDDPFDYRFRVARYSHKIWAYTSAPYDEFLIWLDADTETVNLVLRDVLEKVLPQPGKIASYLGRPYHVHTETGFIGFGPEAKMFLGEIRRMYTSGDVVKLPQWHDCMVFDDVRRRYERVGLRFRNICPEAYGLNVFEQSPLSTIIRHNKGPDRKEREYGNSMLVA